MTWWWRRPDEHQACVTVHTCLSRVDHLEVPEQMIIDLDPGDDPGVVVDAARALHRVLEDIDVLSFPKLTGSRGVHVHIPLEPSAGFDDVRATARAMADILVSRHPGDLTTTADKDERLGALYVDTLRNATASMPRRRTLYGPTPEHPIAAPLSWHEVRAGLDPRRYTMTKMLRRLARTDDPWKGYGRGAPDLSTIPRPDQSTALNGGD